MIHDMSGKGRWAHLHSRNQAHFLDADCHNHVPLAVLLIFADELSAWNRCRLNPEPTLNAVTYAMDRTNVLEEIELISSKDKITVRPVRDGCYDPKEDPIAGAFKKNLQFLKKRKDSECLNIMGYKVYVKPRSR
jgi:hypothetical protein